MTPVSTSAKKEGASGIGYRRRRIKVLRSHPLHVAPAYLRSPFTRFSLEKPVSSQTDAAQCICQEAKEWRRIGGNRSPAHVELAGYEALDIPPAEEARIARQAVLERGQREPGARHPLDILI